jgi:hypothetical protein
VQTTRNVRITCFPVNVRDVHLPTSHTHYRYATPACRHFHNKANLNFISICLAYVCIMKPVSCAILTAFNFFEHKVTLVCINGLYIWLVILSLCFAKPTFRRLHELPLSGRCMKLNLLVSLEIATLSLK